MKSKSLGTPKSNAETFLKGTMQRYLPVEWGDMCS